MRCVYFCEYVHIWCDTVKLVPVNKFLVQNATTNTVQARWTSVRGATGYRLTWQSAGICCGLFSTLAHSLLRKKGSQNQLCNVLIINLHFCLPDGHIENINLGDAFNFYMIQGLSLGTEYTITINPIFGDTEGSITTARIKTCKKLCQNAKKSTHGFKRG